MKLIKNYTKILTLFILSGIISTACNKEELNVARAMHILVNGYNGSENEWEISIDTTVYSKSIRNGDLLIKPGAISTFNRAFIYHTPQVKGMLSIKELGSGKVLFSKPLPTEKKAHFNFIYLDGKELEIPIPAVNPTSNKLGFYIYYPGSNDPIDIFLYRKDAATGQEYRHYFAKNLNPKTWLFIDYLAPADFNTAKLMESTNICFTKAGTTDQWAFEDNETLSSTSARSQFFPIAGETGLAQPYFITPGTNQLDCARLFFYPDRI